MELNGLNVWSYEDFNLDKRVCIYVIEYESNVKFIYKMAVG